MKNLKRAISFELCGKFAQFKKFYTNSSSLTYLIPARTNIIGMLASIMKMPRDSYYKTFSEEEFGIAVKISTGCKIRKQIQTMNYLQSPGSSKQHSQCKLEMLFPETLGDLISYKIYVGAFSDDSLKVLNELSEKISSGDFGYGIYLGQRQFGGDISHLKVFEENELVFMEESNSLDSASILENANINLDIDTRIVTDQMPTNMEEDNSKNKGRKLGTIKRIVYEKTGKTLHGKFKNCWQIGTEIISFL